MTKISLVDSHVHFWNDHLSYFWLKDCPKINKNFAVKELKEAVGSVDLKGAIFVQAECDHSQGLMEVDWVSKLAENENAIKGIVAFAAIEKGLGVQDDLEKLQSNPLVKGVRRLIQWEADSNFCLQPDFIKGIQLLAKFNFSFDICIKAHQLPQTIELVKKCPNVAFVLDHLGKPDIVGKEFVIWVECIKNIAKLPNVFCKISGLINEADHLNWQADDLKPYIYHCINEFGFDRVMFGSDWPVLNLVSDYGKWVEVIGDIMQQYTIAERQKFFVSNSLRFYKVK